MTFTVYTPPAAEAAAAAEGAAGRKKVPVIWYLSGLTCTDENVVQKGGAQRACARRGVALVAPDTSPRGLGVEGEADSWDFGVGAGARALRQARARARYLICCVRVRVCVCQRVQAEGGAAVLRAVDPSARAGAPPTRKTARTKTNPPKQTTHQLFPRHQSTPPQMKASTSTRLSTSGAAGRCTAT